MIQHLQNIDFRALAGVIKSNGSTSSGNTIVWNVQGSPDFLPLFLGTPTHEGDTEINLNYSQTFSFIQSLNIEPSAHLARRGVLVGPSVLSDRAILRAHHPSGVRIGRFTGNGTNWTLAEDATGWVTQTNTIDTFKGRPEFTSGSVADNKYNNRFVFISFTGLSANRKVVKLLTGLNAGNFGFEVRDTTTGNLITSNSANDVIEVFTGFYRRTVLDLSGNQSNGYPGANMLTTQAEFHFITLVEL